MEKHPDEEGPDWVNRCTIQSPMSNKTALVLIAQGSEEIEL